jgi:small subunit ribosomal protein S8
MMTDPIADMLTRIRNANALKTEIVVLPASKIKVEIARVLKEAGYIKNFEVGGELKKEITLSLKYVENVRVINGLKRISKPGLRVHSNYEDLPRVLNGNGIAIISTSKGIMTDLQARRQKIGGEILAFVW